MMTAINSIPSRESGNVLFLILIAVALFAALSYAVTQSSRSGGGDASKETDQIKVAQLLTVPTVYRSTVQRMIASKGIDGGEIVATTPANFNSMSDDFNSRNIYHPTGGGMPYPLQPKEMMDTTFAQDWAFNSENEIKNIGSNSSSASPEINSVDLILFLPGLKRSVCEAINKKLGITGPMPQSAADATLVPSGVPPSYMENGGSSIIGIAATDAVLAGKTEGCFEDSSTAGRYVFYSAIIER